MKEKENIQKIIIAMIQTVVVYFSASLTLTLITPNFKSNKDLLFVLLIHYIVFYLSDFYRDFWSRGYLEEFKMVLKYSFYYIFISSSLFFIFKNSFTTTRLSFFPFIAMNSILLYLLNSFLKYYRKYSYAKFSRDTKVVLITNKDSLSKMTFKNKYDHNYIAVCILDSSEKDCYDLKHNSLRIINKVKTMYNFDIVVDIERLQNVVYEGTMNRPFLETNRSNFIEEFKVILKELCDENQ